MDAGAPPKPTPWATEVLPAAGCRCARRSTDDHLHGETVPCRDLDIGRQRRCPPLRRRCGLHAAAARSAAPRSSRLPASSRCSSSAWQRSGKRAQRCWLENTRLPKCRWTVPGTQSLRRRPPPDLGAQSRQGRSDTVDKAIPVAQPTVVICAEKGATVRYYSSAPTRSPCQTTGR